MRDYEFYYTQDGSIGLYSYKDEDVYHSKFGALTEAWEKFVIPSGIISKLNKTPYIKVLDVCYGIGYNTKALMSFVINTDEKFLRKNIFLKIKNFLSKIFHKTCNTDSIDANNKANITKKLLPPIDSIGNDKTFNNLSKIQIDCLDINEDLVKISPLLKTVVTPQEIFSKIIPNIFKCFDSYWKIKNFLAKISFKFAPKNSLAIKELLDLKFNNDYDIIKNEFKINKLVNYIIIDALIDKYREEYLTKNIKEIITNKKKKHFFDTSLLKYANFKQNYRYNFISRLNLLTFLHNIYYEYLSKRYKKIRSKAYIPYFNLNFYTEDARKSILQINELYDYIFLDAFTFSKAPELWSVEFIKELYERIAPQGLLMTYSNSALVRKTLLDNNFYVGKIYDSKSDKFIGTIASKDKTLIEHPLTNYEIGLCNTKAGIPYHDPTLSLDRKQILKIREQEFKTSDLMTSSQYMKARSLKNKDTYNEE